MKLQRVRDWRDRLNHFIDTYRLVPFSWETHNCGLFCAGVVLAVTGVDIAANEPRAFDSAEAVDAFLAGRGGLEALVTSYLGEPVPVLRARAGDIVGAELPDGFGIGLCRGGMCAFVGPQGLRPLRLSHCTRAWRVG